jgi:hypothetical protein
LNLVVKAVHQRRDLRMAGDGSVGVESSVHVSAHAGIGENNTIIAPSYYLRLPLPMGLGYHQADKQLTYG